MSFVAVAIAGSAAIGAGASIYGAKKQAKGAKQGADTQMAMFDTINRQQQPYIQSGYNAMGRLNTLLGLGNRPTPSRPGMAPVGNQMYRPTPGGGIRQIASVGSQPQSFNLARLLQMRAMNGDREAARIFGDMP